MKKPRICRAGQVGIAEVGVRSRPGETVFEIALPAVASSYPTSERA